jgi:hypothetical protein
MHTRARRHRRDREGLSRIIGAASPPEIAPGNRPRKWPPEQRSCRECCKNSVAAGCGQTTRSNGIGPTGQESVVHAPILRIRIWPEASSAQISMSRVSAQGSTVCPVIPFRRASAFLVLADFHCDGSRRVQLKNRSPASSRRSAATLHVGFHLHRNPVRSVSIPAMVSVQIMSR